MFRKKVSHPSPGCLSLLLFVFLSSLSMGQAPLPQERLTSPADSSRQQIAELIEQLSDPVFQKRRNAQWALKQLGLQAFEQLREAATRHPNIEVANSARYLIQSQDIVWFLESDSIEVRSILKKFDELEETQRILRVEMLAKRDSADAVLALCRLARYERHERVSKEAALKLIERLTQRPVPEPELINSVALAVGNGDRPSVQWVLQLLRDLDSQAGVDAEKWSELAANELKWLQEAPTNDSRKLVLDLFTRICAWIRQENSAEAALEFVKPCVELVQGNVYHLQQFTLIVLDDLETPALVTELFEANQESFSGDAGLLYLLAESYRKAGDETKATRFAEQASNRIGNPPEQIKNLSRGNSLDPVELEVNNRRIIAERLASRGLYDWAEQEYLKAINSESRQSVQIRADLADFYWFGGENRKAADVLAPVAKDLEAALKNAEEGDKLPPRLSQRVVGGQRNLRLATFYFYQGLALTEEGEIADAQASLRKAFEYQPENPDIVIAMQHVASDVEYREFYEKCLRDMGAELRKTVIQAEEQLARSQDRDQRRREEAYLAHYCNQLAWLLGMCKVNTDEAVKLSERSNELSKDEAVYLDTLARCYFSAGRVQKAVETQQRALAIAPHERQMQAQLREFKAGLPTQNP